VKLRRVDDTFLEIDWKDIFYRKIADDVYVINSDNEFLKVTIDKNRNLKLSSKILNSYPEALADKGILTYQHERPKGFGLSEDDLMKKIYVSDVNFAKYYSFDQLPMGNNLIQVNAQGPDSYLGMFKYLAAKSGKYILSRGGGSDVHKILLRISPTQLQDADTGESYTLSTKSAYDFKKDIEQRLGKKEDPVIIRPTPKVNKKPDEKTFDFADDKDDDYYDTYDDFGLNEGD